MKIKAVKPNEIGETYDSYQVRYDRGFYQIIIDHNIFIAEKIRYRDDILIGFLHGMKVTSFVIMADNVKEIVEALKAAKWQCLEGNPYPYRIEELEALLRSVVNYETDLENRESTENARETLKEMGFSEEQMRYFGLPEIVG